MRQLNQPEPIALSIQYRPDAETVFVENPPRFTWMSEGYEREAYTLQISCSADFAQERTTTVEAIPLNYYTPDHALAAGSYYWRYALILDGERSEWSDIRSFTVPEELPETPLSGRSERYRQAESGHPRLWLNGEQVAEFRRQVRQDAAYCGWDVFYDKSVKVWLERELIPEPQPYPNNKKRVDLWRQMYIDCQETLYAVRHLSVAGVILEDEAILSRAREWLLHVAAWDPNGPTSRDYNDEAAFRTVGALAWGYDWLYHRLSAEERERVRAVLLRRLEQVAYHVMVRSKIHLVPYDSHAVRSLSSVLVPCCIALFDEVPQAREWLDYTLEYYSCLYTPWGGADGGWAEGAMYWTTGMAYLIDAMNLLKNFAGIDFYRRPFFQKTGDFPLYCYSPDTARASFGDQSNLGEKPILKTAFNIRQFAGVTGNGLYQWYYEQVKARDTDPDSKFYNWGWWDFRFDDMLYRHDYGEVPAVAPTEAEQAKWFRDIGWVAFHHEMASEDDHIMFLTKSSPYGSISHSHGDQNSILIHAFGEPLAIKSGYYVGFNTTMHTKWRRQTRSHNSLLIDGVGQYAEINKFLNISARGVIEQVESTGKHRYVKANATEAYRETVPYLKDFTRETYFVDGSYLVVVDSVSLAQAGKVNWLLHALHEFQITAQTFRIPGVRAELDGRFVYCSSGKLDIAQYDGFPDVDPQEWAGLPTQWHLTATTNEAHEHRIVTLLTPKRKGERKYVTDFVDDQGHGLNIYFTEKGETFHLHVATAY